MNYIDQFTVSKDPSFIAVVQQAIVQKALAVREESPETPNHAARMILATKVLQSPIMMASLMASAVVSDPDLNAKIAVSEVEGQPVVSWTFSDAEVLMVVDGLWNSYCYF